MPLGTLPCPAAYPQGLNGAMSSATTLTFLGATGSVTGSKFLLTVGQRRVLIDAGAFQGERELRRRNWEPFPIDPSLLTDVVLTHAHLDHCGYLPALVRNGFHGPVWATAATTRLAEIVLRDAAHLQERDALDAAEGGWSKHNPPKPLYDTADVEATLPLLTAVDYDRDLDLGDGLWARFTRAGHILGSASVRIETPTTSVLFSGDLGRHDHPVLRPRDLPPGAAYVLVESTYGDREHPEPRELPHEGLADVIRRTVARGGSVLVPAFAVDRTEVGLKTLADMRRHGRIPRVPIVVNSPMALDALAAYRDNASELRTDLHLAEVLGDVTELRTADDSRAFTESRHGPTIIISSSGMATGGRVLHHLARLLPDPRNAVVLTGYQSPGTRGRALVEGATRLKMHGQYVGVRAEILHDKEFSVHADASDLIDWLGALRPAPATVFCVHGEPDSAAALAGRIERELRLDAVVPRLDEVVALAARTPPVRSDTVVDASDGYAVPGATLPGRPGSDPAASDRPPVVVPVVTVGGIPVEGIHVETDLRPRQLDDRTVVLEGTITIRVDQG